MIAFYGTYTHSVDSAGRFILPKKFRNVLGEDFLITKGVGCLLLFPQEYLNETLAPAVERLGKNPIRGLYDADVTRWQRHLFSEMVATNDDTQSRVPLTQEHRDYAGIDNEVAICGRGQVIELWSPQALQEDRQANSDIRFVLRSAKTVETMLSRLLEENVDAGISQAGSSQ